jgi:hypothetical protein
MVLPLLFGGAVADPEQGLTSVYEPGTQPTCRMRLLSESSDTRAREPFVSIARAGDSSVMRTSEASASRVSVAQTRYANRGVTRRCSIARIGSLRS